MFTNSKDRPARIASEDRRKVRLRSFLGRIFSKESIGGGTNATTSTTNNNNGNGGNNQKGSGRLFLNQQQ